MSGIHPKADIHCDSRNVCFVPIADIAVYLQAHNCSKSKRALPEWSIHRRNRKNRMTDDWKKTVHRNKLLGMWAAEKLGITGQDAEDYSDALAVGTLDPEREDVLSNIRKDFDAAGVVQSDEQILRASDALTVLLARKLAASPRVPGIRFPAWSMSSFMTPPVQ
jgi:hypothetical protein